MILPKKTGIPVEAFQLMYRQFTYNPISAQSNEIECELEIMLMGRYTEARDVFQNLLSRTKKASSLVENLNGRIWAYVEVKRLILTKFFILLKCTLITRAVMVEAVTKKGSGKDL